MGKTAQFTDPQFVDAAGVGGLDTAFSTVAADTVDLAKQSIWLPGLLQPEFVTLTPTGLTVAATLPAPFAVQFSDGKVVGAHGTLTNRDTQSYSVAFSGLVPGSGSVTAYLVASRVAIQQDSVPIPGPPRGHPAYNPLYQPIVGYATDVDSLTLTATTTAPNNSTIFEIARGTLTAGGSGISDWTLANQVRATGLSARCPSVIVSSTALTIPQLRQGIVCGGTGLTSTLPAAQRCAGLSTILANPQGGDWIIVTSGSDQILGTDPAVGVSTITVPINSTAYLWCDGSFWYVAGASPNLPLIAAYSVWGNPTNAPRAGQSVPAGGGIGMTSGGGLFAKLAAGLSYDVSGSIQVNNGDGITFDGLNNLKIKKAAPFDFDGSGHLIDDSYTPSSLQQRFDSGTFVIGVWTAGSFPFVYTDLQTVSFTFPASSPTTKFLLHVDSTLDVSANANGSPVSGVYSGVQFAQAITSVYDNTNAGETLFVDGGPLTLTGSASGAGQMVQRSGYSQFAYDPGSTISIIHRATLANTGAFPYLDASVAGHLVLTAVPAG